MSKTSTRRVLTVLEAPLFTQVSKIAKRDGLSMSQKVRDLLRDAVERDEDADLVTVVQARKKSGGKWHGHDDFWQKAAVK